MGLAVRHSLQRHRETFSRLLGLAVFRFNFALKYADMEQRCQEAMNKSFHRLSLPITVGMTWKCTCGGFGALGILSGPAKGILPLLSKEQSN